MLNQINQDLLSGQACTGTGGSVRLRHDKGALKAGVDPGYTGRCGVMSHLGVTPPFSLRARRRSLIISLLINDDLALFPPIMPGNCRKRDPKTPSPRKKSTRKAKQPCIEPDIDLGGGMMQTSWQIESMSISTSLSH
jgi:hypothetical protein